MQAQRGERENSQVVQACKTELQQLCQGQKGQQAEQCLKNLGAIATAAGTTLSNTVKTTVLLTDLGQFAEINKVYAGFFAKPFPARACYEVSALPKGAKVEIEAVIAIP